MKILFVCTGNTCRSPMAKALLGQRLRERGGKGEIEVWSAGLFTHDGLPASPEAVEAMRAEGIDISSHRARLITGSLIKDADLILTMTANQRDCLQEWFPHKAVNTYTLNEFTGDKNSEVADPFGLGREAYQRSLGQLKRLVDRLYYKIIKMR